MNKEIKEELCIEAASRVHADWCNEELKAYFNRAQGLYSSDKNRGLVDILTAACMKNGKVRNEVEVDEQYLDTHSISASEVFEKFDTFKSLFDKGVVIVKRFAKRDLTSEEISRIGKDYKEGQENILRDFRSLSADSKKENLDAAIGALNVYEQLSKVGITLEQMKSDPEIVGTIGVAIHADWLSRNMDHPNESLKVPYSQLDEWTQSQDITVFNALLSIVEKDREKYFVAADGSKIPDYAAQEREALKLRKKP